MLLYAYKASDLYFVPVGEAHVVCFVTNVALEGQGHAPDLGKTSPEGNLNSHAASNVAGVVQAAQEHQRARGDAQLAPGNVAGAALGNDPGGGR